MASIPFVGYLKAWPIIVAGWVSLCPYSGSSYPLNTAWGMLLRWLGKPTSLHAAKQQGSSAVRCSNQTRTTVDFLAQHSFGYGLSVVLATRSKETYPLLEALWKI
ncbi:MAG: hypothetical protein PHU14_05935 [Methylovulum sp.]|nr:hypothetical protein [Methylovulum sp.]